MKVLKAILAVVICTVGAVLILLVTLPFAIADAVGKLDEFTNWLRINEQYREE
jgi:hypothetical protein